MSASRIPRIVVVSSKIEPAELTRLVGRGGTVRFVVDVDRELAAIGGEAHEAAADLLIERGSRPDSLWRGSYAAGCGPEACIVYVSSIDVPSSHRRRRTPVEHDAICGRVRAIVFKLIGTGEPLA